MASQAIGIDIGNHSVKVAVLQRKGAVTRALRLFRAPLAGDTDPVRVQGALARAGIAGGPGLVGITGRDLIIRYTHLPPVPDWRLKLLMQFEINEVSGQSGEEVAADFRRLQLPNDSGEDTVLVALARTTWLGPRINAARGAGMKVSSGCPNSVAVFNAFLAHGSLQEGETTYLVSIGRDNIDMAVQRDGDLLFARNMAGGGGLFTEAIMQTFGLKEPKAEANKLKKGDLTPTARAQYADSTTEKLANAMQAPAGQLVSMIQSTVMICRAQVKMPDLKVDRVLVTGGGAQLKGLAEYLGANMDVPVELFDPVAALDLSGLHGQDAEELGEQQLDFAAAVGLAETLLQPNAYRLEVLSEKDKKARHFTQRTIWNLFAAAAALILVVLMFQTRAADIAVVKHDNGALEQLKRQRGKIGKRGAKAYKAELDARRKELVLHARLRTGQFGRRIVDLIAAERMEYIFLRTLQMRTEKVGLDLDGNEVEKASLIAGQASDDTKPIVDQPVRPVLEIEGTVQKTGGNPNQRYKKYVDALKANLPAVAGRKAKMDTTILSSAQKFTLTFGLPDPQPAASGDKEGG